MIVALLILFNYKMISLVHSLCRVQYTSNLFIDLFEKTGSFHFIKPSAPILVLNGNIGQPNKKQTHDFIRYCSYNWDTVYYIPGAYELKNGGLNNVGLMRYHYGKLTNVLVLNNEAHLNRQTRTLFMGTYNDTDWIKDWCKKITPENTGKIVALSYKKPNPDNTYPRLSAWIYGDTIGGKQVVYRNGLLVAYNGRGRIDRSNDFMGKDGWSRSAQINVPELI